MDDNNIYKMLTNIVNPSNIFLNEDMKKHTSFKIGGTADFFVKAESIDEIRSILKFTREKNISLTVIGNGSNLLVKDNGIRGITLKINLNNIQIQTSQEMKEIYKQLDKVAEEDIKYSSQAIVTVGAGVPLGMLAQKLMINSISGFEFASGIPGTIGGAIVMNAGAYGKEFKEIVIQTTYMDEFGEIYVINNEQHEFGYRDSIFKKHKYIILETQLLLKLEEDNNVIKQKMEELSNQRKEKQPSNPSAGSTFKRGKDFITAKLIDECGLKGYSIGGAQVSQKHAGFIINNGNATADEVIELIKCVKKKVKEKFDKDIQLEIQIIGD